MEENGYIVADPAQYEIVEVKIKSIEKLDRLRSVYCLSAINNGTMICNGIITKNCDSLRYALASCFPTGELNHPDEMLSIEQLRRQVYGDEPMFLNPPSGGYY